MFTLCVGVFFFYHNLHRDLLKNSNYFVGNNFLVGIKGLKIFCSVTISLLSKYKSTRAKKIFLIRFFQNISLKSIVK